MGPAAFPNAAALGIANASPQPTSRHTTRASVKSQPLLHTVPHCWLWSTSTLPVQAFVPPASLSSVGRENGMKDSTSVVGAEAAALHANPFRIYNKQQYLFDMQEASWYVDQKHMLMVFNSLPLFVARQISPLSSSTPGSHIPTLKWPCYPSSHFLQKKGVRAGQGG